MSTPERHSARPTEAGRRPHLERGAILYALMFLTVLMGGLILVALEEGRAERTSLTHYETSMRALEIAEMGLLRAEMEISGGVDVDGDGLGNVSGRFAGGGYEVEAVQDPADPSRWTLTARTTHRLSARQVEVGLRQSPGGLFTHALFGLESVRLTGGSWTDSYDSRLGPYAAQAFNLDGYGPYAEGGSDVGSNGEIKVSGGGVVRGDAIPGTFDVTEITGGSAVWGETAPRSEDREIPNPPYEEFLAAFTANDNASIDVSHPKVDYDAAALEMISGGGASIELTGGTYIFNTLKMTGGGNLIISGPSKIYITNHFEISGGGIANLAARPGDCVIIAHPYDFPAGSPHDKLRVRTSGGSRTALAVYAPAFDYVTSGGGDLYGSLIARTIVFSGGSGFHYDRALGDLGGGSGRRVERLYWVDRAVPRR